MAFEEGKFDWSQEAPNREKLWLFVILGLVVYVFFALVWGPQRGKTKHYRSEVDNVQTQIDAAQKLVEATVQAAQSGVVEAPPGIAPDDPRFAPYLRGELRPSEDVLEEVVAAVTSPQALRGIELVGFQQMAANETEHYRRIPFELRLEGPFGATVQYLEYIEALPLLIVYDDVDVLSPEGNRAVLKVTLKASLYVVKSASALASPAAVPVPLPAPEPTP